MKYQVLEGTTKTQAKLCSYHHFPVHKSWKQHTYNSFIEAYNYAQKWLGMYRMKHLKLDTPTEYNWAGDTIEIRRIK